MTFKNFPLVKELPTNATRVSDYIPKALLIDSLETVPYVLRFRAIYGPNRLANLFRAWDLLQTAIVLLGKHILSGPPHNYLLFFFTMFQM